MTFKKHKVQKRVLIGVVKVGFENFERQKHEFQEQNLLSPSAMQTFFEILLQGYSVVFTSKDT